MDPALRRLVRDRASDRCEYCGIRQVNEPFFLFHVEHIIARQHGGPTELGNLALSCHHCNLHKGPNLSGIDPLTTEIVVLYNPRRQPWKEHFTVRGPLILGLSSTGRATVRLLQMNAPGRIKLRQLALAP